MNDRLLRKKMKKKDFEEKKLEEKNFEEKKLEEKNQRKKIFLEWFFQLFMNDPIL